ncbi:MAG: hypothetical protein KKA90_02720 [Nanoarchaeota archaeon]|nr:hypothetical protein [Nanoarchaeota archaeon]
MDELPEETRTRRRPQYLTVVYAFRIRGSGVPEFPLPDSKEWPGNKEDRRIPLVLGPAEEERLCIGDVEYRIFRSAQPLTARGEYTERTKKFMGARSYLQRGLPYRHRKEASFVDAIAEDTIRYVGEPISDKEIWHAMEFALEHNVSIITPDGIPRPERRQARLFG